MFVGRSNTTANADKSRMSAMREPVLELTNATVKKDDTVVLHSLNLTIHEGEHTAILGPNGAGKSILVRLLTHEERPLPLSNGSAPVRVFGQDNWNVWELRSQLGIVSSDLHQRFVSGNSEGRITGEMAVISGFIASQGILRYSTITDDMRRRAAESLHKMGVSHLAKRWLNEMSSGEARRVLIARALVTQPRALVLDEPTSNLDVVARHSFLERVRQIAREGTTLILITHHVEEVIPEIERVIFIKHGRIAGEGVKRTVMTAGGLGGLFDGPVALDELDGYYYARSTHDALK
jgi:iron complex transport system ATP-binding protein